MLIELITPLMLATSPATFDASNAVYSHQSQQVVAYEGSTKAIAAYGSTRSYDMYGKPNDNDND
jgi:hypothetical protein